jgi:SET domain-containing protein
VLQLQSKNVMFPLLQNRGIYMFRLDEDRVVDATLSGGLARYINHSCNPNCVAEIVEVERDLRIIIFAKRRISRGEEVSAMLECLLYNLGVRFMYLGVDHSDSVT